ncbi:MAG: peptide-methionine (S)-S-oxide reductase MsrA, partial [Desulfovibrionaceae bacterium]
AATGAATGAAAAPPRVEGRAIFAGGCFWGVEDAFQKVEGVSKVVSGYTGGTVPNPSYEQVCSGRTGHAEAVEVHFDSAKVGYETLARLFFEIHDPTQQNRQGPDVGTQYRSAVFYTDSAQHAVLESLIQQLQAKGWDVVTQLAPATTFYPAEDYHQNFTARTGRGGCHRKVPRFEQGPTGNLF